MTTTTLRGRALTFHRAPERPDDERAWSYWNDAGIAIEDGRITAIGEFSEVSKSYPGDVIDYRPHLIMPGFIDPHLHFVQMQVVGSYAANLLEWLNTYTFIEEQKFASSEHGRRIASAFFDTLIRHGTTTAVAYCSVHPASVDAFFSEAAKRDMLMIGGKCMMDRNCPPELRDTPQTGYDDSVALVEKWHGKGRAHYAITPRFAITSTPAQLDMVGQLRREYPHLHLQTHLSENAAEIEYTAELFPDEPDYLGVYERYGLVGEKCLFGHAIHLTDREVAVMAETGSVAVSCPTSNLFLGSGLFDHDRLAGAGVPIAVATDIGGGTSYSMLQTLDEMYKVLQLRGQRFHPLLAFYRVTLGNALALGLADRVGTLEPGSDADLVVLNASATPEMAIRMETVETLPGELFLLQTRGDDRAIVQTYVAGRALKKPLE